MTPQDAYDILIITNAGLFILGALLGALVMLFVIGSALKKLRISGREVARKGVYTFTEHTPETLKEYLDEKAKDRRLS